MMKLLLVRLFVLPSAPISWFTFTRTLCSIDRVVVVGMSRGEGVVLRHYVKNRSGSLVPPLVSTNRRHICAHIEIKRRRQFHSNVFRAMATEAPIQVINPLCRMDSASTIRSQSPQAMAMASGPFISDITHSVPSASATSCKQSDGKYSSLAAARKKKSVTFFNAARLYKMKNVPPASAMSQREKDVRWFTPKDYEGFKYDAATQAGIRLVRYERGEGKLSSSKQPNFVMLGSFDNEADGGSSEGESVARLHYNENEYNEPPNGDVCKRGLGYHFSRHRKRAKLITKGAVMAWQRALNDPTNPKYAKMKVDSSGKGKKRASFILALVANKCAKIPAEEARWRGEMDYFAAYPELHLGKKYPNLPGGGVFSPKTPIDVPSSQKAIETDPEKSSLEIPTNVDDRKRPASFDGSDDTPVQSNKKARPGEEREEELFSSPRTSFDDSDGTPVLSNKKVRPFEQRGEELFLPRMSPPISPASFDMLSESFRAEV